MNRAFKLKLHFALLVKLAEINCRVNYWMTVLVVADVAHYSTTEFPWFWCKHEPIFIYTFVVDSF